MSIPYRAFALAAASAALVVSAPASGVTVLVLSSGDTAIDTAVIGRLQTSGHAPTLGPAFTAFDGTQSLAPYQAVYFQANSNWNTGDMPAAGQQVLLAFVANGGGLVTSEWVVWKWAAQGTLQTIGGAFAAQRSVPYTGAATATYVAASGAPLLRAGLPGSFTFPVDNFGGTETQLSTAPGAVSYFTSGAGGSGVVGRVYGAGRVVHLSTTMGANSVNDPNAGRLLANALTFAAHRCVPDFDGDGAVQPADVALFVTAWVADLQNGTLAADFDRSGSVQPADVAGYIGAWFAAVASPC